MDKSHALLLAAGFAAGLLAGTFFSLGGGESGMVLPPTIPPTPAPPAYVCTVVGPRPPAEARYALKAAPLGPGIDPSYVLALNCSPAP